MNQDYEITSKKFSSVPLPACLPLLKKFPWVNQHIKSEGLLRSFLSHNDVLFHSSAHHRRVHDKFSHHHLYISAPHPSPKEGNNGVFYFKPVLEICFERGKFTSFGGEGGVGGFNSPAKIYRSSITELSNYRILSHNLLSLCSYRQMIIALQSL